MDMEEMGAINLMEEDDDILTDDNCNTVIYLQMVPGLDLPLNSDTTD
jgi:hypothetical protein